MATSRIPGRASPQTGTSQIEESCDWPNVVVHRHLHHMPGAASSCSDGSWRIARFVAPSDRENVDAYFNVLTKWEGLVLYMYLDTNGYVTVGIGKS